MILNAPNLTDKLSTAVGGGLLRFGAQEELQEEKKVWQQEAAELQPSGRCAGLWLELRRRHATPRALLRHPGAGRGRRRTLRLQAEEELPISCPPARRARLRHPSRVAVGVAR